MAMNNITIPQKFTDLNYAMKSNLHREFGPMVDPYWALIKKYRDQYRVPLNVRTIANVQMSVVLTDAITSKVMTIENGLKQLANKVASLNDLIESSQAKRAMVYACLESIKNVAKVDISDRSFNALVNDTYFENNPGHQVLINHLDSITSFASQNPKPFSASSEAEIFANYLKTEELTKFYRTVDFDNSVKNIRFQINGIYPYAPHEYIDRCMEGFHASINESSEHPLIRALLAMYFIMHVKPFDEGNETVASLSAKWIMSDATKNTFAFYLPFEALLDKPNVKVAMDEVQKTGDFTYYLDYSLNILKSVIEKLENKIADIRIDTYREESTRIPEIEKEVEPTPITVEQKIIEPVKATPIVEEQKEVEEVEVIPHQEKQVVAPVETLTREQIDSTPVGRNPALSDKEVKEYIIYLMETEPDLNKKQASFYATHCTEGRYYSIQQFKAYTKCVYETARTSMDKLAAKGFYKKCALKNKFVYTPTKKRR